MVLSLVGNTWRERRIAGDLLEDLAFDPTHELWVFVGPGASPLFDGEILTVPAADLFDLSVTPAFTVRATSGNDAIRAVASNKLGDFRAVSDRQETYRSADGIAWQLVFVAGGLFDSRAVDFGPTNLPGSLFELAGEDILARQNAVGGLTWTNIDITVEEHFGIANNGANVWIAVGGAVAGTGRVKLSTDGLA